MNNKRTEHMVKNRFNSLIASESKKYGYEVKTEFLISKIYQRLISLPLVGESIQNNEIKGSPKQGRTLKKCCRGLEVHDDIKEK